MYVFKGTKCRILIQTPFLRLAKPASAHPNVFYALAT